MAQFGVQVFDESGRLQATLTENEISVVHYSFLYLKGKGKPRDMKFLAERVREYPNYKTAGGVNIGGSSTWAWDSGSNGFEFDPQQPLIMGQEWYALSAVAEENARPLIRPWTMPGSTCIYDRATNKFLCRAENAHIFGLYITVGSK